MWNFLCQRFKENVKTNVWWVWLSYTWSFFIYSSKTSKVPSSSPFLWLCDLWGSGKYLYNVCTHAPLREALRTSTMKVPQGAKWVNHRPATPPPGPFPSASSSRRRASLSKSPATFFTFSTNGRIATGQLEWNQLHPSQHGRSYIFAS